MAWLKRLFGDKEEGERGSVLVLGALSLVGVLGFAGLAVEGGAGYAAKIRNQRVADMAALGAAVAYQAASTYSSPIDKATQTARDIALANGGASTVAVDRVTVNAQDAIKVSITTNVPIRLAAVIASGPSYSVSNAAYASLAGSSDMGGCIQALSAAPQYGITLSGGTSISATGCSVVTNGGVTVPWGTHIYAKQVSAGKTVNDPAYANNPSQPANAGVVTSPSVHNVQENQSTPAVDKVAADALVTAGFNRIGPGTMPDTSSTDPSTPAGPDWNFPNGAYAYSITPASDPVKANCTSDGNKTYTCAGGPYTIGKITIPGDTFVNFTATTTINIAGGIANGGNKLTFAGGTIRINGGVNSGSGGIDFGNANITIGSGGMTVGSGGITIGNGTVIMNTALNASGGGITVRIGRGSHSFKGISVGGGGKVYVDTGNLNLNGSLAVDGGGSTVTFADGNYVIGNNGAGNAINLSGGSVLSFGNGQFSANGSITTSGGSTLTFGVTASHYINGTLSLNGSSTFGAGAYYINGDFTNNTGGSMSGTDVTFFMKGTLTLSGGTSMTMKAPTDNSSGGVANLLFATKSTAQTKLGGGSQNVYQGLVYAPNSDMNMDGGAGVTGNGGCFMLIVNTLTMNGGTTTGTNCSSIGSGGSGGGTPKLLQ